MSAIEARVRAGERLSEAELRALAAIDVLTLGALADEARRHRHGDAATFGRVLFVDAAGDAPVAAVPDAAGEVRLRGLGATLEDTVAAVRAARAAAGTRCLTGFSLAEIEARSREGWADLGAALAALREAGLDGIAEAPIDRLPDDGRWLGWLRDAGLAAARVTVERELGPDRVALLLRVRGWQDAGAGFRAMAPLPRTQSPATPTTGYDDVRAVALARLALDNVPTIQVDWQIYGPKLAQVALTFGADDLDGVAADEDPGRGWRRAADEEARRNIAAVALTAVERDGRFAARPADAPAGGPA